MDSSGLKLAPGRTIVVPCRRAAMIPSTLPKQWKNGTWRQIRCAYTNRGNMYNIFIYSESRTVINYFERFEDLKRRDYLENMDVGRKLLLQWNFNQQVINWTEKVSQHAGSCHVCDKCSTCKTTEKFDTNWTVTNCWQKTEDYNQLLWRNKIVQ